MPQDYIESAVSLKMREIEHRLTNFRGSKEYYKELEGKTIVLVDDGIAIGATMISAARWLKKKQNCRDLVIGVPVAPPDTVDRLNQIVEHHDKVIVPYSPGSFRAVAQFYKNFEKVTDNEVKLIMKRREYNVDI